MELRKKFLSVAALAFAAALSTGIAVSATAEEDNTLEGFGITGYSVRTENFKDKQGVEVENSTGLRFKTVTPDAKDAYEDAYTIITVAGAAEEADQAKVSAQVWRSEGNGWNTVLLGIPAEAYGTEITAQSYVVLDGQLYETEPFTISIDVAASKALNMGYTNDVLYDYTANTVESITLDKATLALDQLTPTATLTATVAPEKYSVVWASSNTKVATVDNTGKVTAVGAGTANITATMGGVTSEACAVTVGAMPITFENGEETAVAKLLTGANANSVSTVTCDVADFNGGKAYGTSATGITDRDLYFAMPYSVFSTYFTAYPNCAAVTFDTYSTHAVNQGRWYHGIASEGASGNNNMYLMVGGASAKVNVNGTDYYKTTWTISRASFENYTANISLVFRYYGVFGSVLSEFYVDNVGAIVEYQANLDFESGRYSPIAYIGKDATTSGYTFAPATVKDAAGNETTSRMFAANATGLTSSTIYFPVDRGYLDTVFADESVTHFQFDIIANWSTDTLVIEDNTWTQTSLATWADAEAVSVNNTAGFYKLTVRFARATYEVDGTHDANFVTFRFKWGGQPTAVYFDNFQAVTVHNVLSDTYYDRNTVSANSETGATTTSSSSTFALCFDQGKMVDAFYTKGAESISFTLEADGYDIVGFRTWSGNLLYCRPVIWKGGVGTAASHEPLNNATFEIVDGKAIITIAASEFTTYFDANGDYIAGSHAAVTEAVGFGIRLSVQYMDGETLTTIPSDAVYTISNFTLNYAQAE